MMPACVCDASEWASAGTRCNTQLANVTDDGAGAEATAGKVDSGSNGHLVAVLCGNDAVLRQLCTQGGGKGLDVASHGVLNRLHLAKGAGREWWRCAQQQEGPLLQRLALGLWLQRPVLLPTVCGLGAATESSVVQHVSLSVSRLTQIWRNCQHSYSWRLMQSVNENVITRDITQLRVGVGKRRHD